MSKRDIIYLKDIFIISISAFGGPQAHLAMMLNVLVHKRKYLTEEELLELSALCQMLPGPGSTQTITAVSLKKGGTLLAVLTLLIWILPAAILMSLLTVLFTLFERRGFSTDFLLFVPAMAVGFIASAGFKVGKAVIKNATGFAIMILALLTTIFIISPWTFPLSLILGGVITNFTNKSKAEKPQQKYLINWTHSTVALGLFFGIFILAAVLGALTKFLPFVLFENFYRFGSITYGGGSVLMPMMFEQFVKHRHYLSADEFLSGYAINQALPGPAFAFATFTGGMAIANLLGFHYQILGCLIGTVAIFLPSILLIFAIYPVWQYLKNYKFIKRSLEGINAAATGLVLGAAVIIYTNLEFHWINIVVIVLTFCALNFTRIQAPWLVLLALIAGFGYTHFV